MNPSTADPTAEPLLFNWEPPQRERLAIAGFLVLSLVAHAFCFYVFQVVYPPTVALLPPPARVGLITSNSEESRNVLRWIEAEDPALAFTTQLPAEAKLRELPKAEHIPSYLSVQPVLKEVPPVTIDSRIPSVHPPGPVPPVRRKVKPAVTPTRTSVYFSEELDRFGKPALPTINFTASSSETPQAVRFRIAINSAGEIRYCFPMNSSGDALLDEQARQYVALCRFTSPGEQISDLVWGVATLEWGTDVARTHAPAESATP